MLDSYQGMLKNPPESPFALQLAALTHYPQTGAQLNGRDTRKLYGCAIG